MHDHNNSPASSGNSEASAVPLLEKGPRDPEGPHTSAPLEEAPTYEPFSDHESDLLREIDFECEGSETSVGLDRAPTPQEPQELGESSGEETDLPEEIDFQSERPETEPNSGDAGRNAVRSLSVS